MDSFVMNGYSWRVMFVRPDDPMLVDRTLNLTIGTTDPVTRTVYLSDELEGDILRRVLVHELGHCAMFSFGLIDDIHRMVIPKYWIDVEEWVCNFIADYGMIIFEAAEHVLGDRAWTAIPFELERLVA